MNEEIFQNLTSSLEKNDLEAAKQILHEISVNSLSEVERGKILAELAMSAMRLEMDSQRPYQESMKELVELLKQLQTSEQELVDIEGLRSARNALS